MPNKREIVASLSCLACFLAVLFASARVDAASPGWFATPYNYVVLDQGVRIALIEFGRNLGLPVVVSDKIDGRIRGRIDAKTAGQFVDQVANANGLTWYFDGAVLHVSSDEEFTTRVIDVGRLQPDAVAKEMRAVGFADERFSLQSSPNGNSIRVSGPPAYVNIVGQLVESMQPESSVNGDDPRVRVFRGGVATVLGSDEMKEGSWPTGDSERAALQGSAGPRMK
ncbi:type III secretion protein (plasmid) [Rhizobium leguminosarum]|uniref:type III secretion protein n=1 Tax=Rhizobium TaxID=379 RepID=UPI00102F940D|nr:MULTISPECIES: type III secretion protein [Rhizobium]MBY5378370.1 type III secretion protein [Rhizobium leguminosarum]TBF35120.1 type III secretion protein [Rhizobium leguminosarum]TBF87980.1 type III secretion protein [Rhizobium leguminosarum]WSH48660.1 type III secretion protein [Rhizobium johnstonii]